MSDTISWPIGPLEGDQYSFNGKFWEWNGCAWISTCCPGVCDIYDTGITLGITQEIKWGPNEIEKTITTKICFSYDAQTGTWNSESLNDQGDYYQMIEDSPGTWELNYMQLGTVKSTLGGLKADVPVGLWDWKPEGQKAESICGCPPIICGCGQTVLNGNCTFITFFPVSFTGVSGATEGWVDTSNKYYLYYNVVDSLWELYTFGSNITEYTISLPITTVPIGDWTIGDPGPFNDKYIYFSTEVGHCNPCNEYTDGVILAYTTNLGESNQLTTYVPLTWNLTLDQFENNDGTIYIEYNGATNTWNLWINGSLVYAHNSSDPLGFWGGPDKYTSITILCGNTSVTNTEGCLTAVSVGEDPSTLYLQENTFGEFNYGYPFSQPQWQIICDTGVWYIQSWNGDIWVTEATATGPCNVPPYDLIWTLDPLSNYDEFTFTEGPCPVVCNSYTFRSNNPDGTQVSFKLCGCEQVFVLNLIGTNISAEYCVQEDSIDLGAFGSKQLVSAPCIPNLDQCYTIAIRNGNQNDITTFSYIDCNGNTQNVTLQPGGENTICGKACTINVTSGSIYPIIIGLGCT